MAVFRINVKPLLKADLLREYSEKHKLNEYNLYFILNGEIKQRDKPQPNRTPTVKVRKDVYSKYFRSDQSQQEIQEIVEEALELYFSQE